MNKVLLYSIIWFHHFVIFMLAFNFIAVWFTFDLHIAAMFDIIIGRIALSNAPCPLTYYEDKLRRKLGKPEVKQFIKYYYITPLGKLFRRK